MGRPLQAQTVELKPVKRLMLVLLTWKVSSAVAESLTILKIQEQGMPKEHAALLALLLPPGLPGQVRGGAVALLALLGGGT